MKKIKILLFIVITLFFMSFGVVSAEDDTSQTLSQEVEKYKKECFKMLVRSSAPALPPAYFRLPEPCGEPPFSGLQIRPCSSFTTKPSAREGFVLNGG